MMTTIEFIGNFWLFIGIFFLVLVIIGFKTKKNEKFDKTPPISLIIAAWNEGPRIKKCINSILRQNYKNKIEIIVVGGGKDNTTEVCKNLSKERKIKFIHEKKRMGKWFSLNRGVKVAKNKLLVFFDADCIMSKNWLKKMALSMKNIDIGMAYVAPVSEKNFIEKILSVFSIILFYSFKNLTNFFDIGGFFGTGGMVKGGVFKKIKFKKSLVEDIRVGIDAKKADFKIGTISDATCYFSVSKNLSGLKKQFLRWFYGITFEFLSEKNFLSFILSVSLFSIFVGLPFYMFNLLILNQFTIITSFVFLIILFIFVLLLSIKQKTKKYILYIPHLIFLIVFFLIIELEVILRILFKKEPRWHTIKKKL